MDKFTRIAIIDPEKCKPTKCNQECRRICPVVQIGKQCITVDKTINVPAQISETLCIGCGMCVAVCPHRVFQLNNKKAEIIDRDACMECGACSRNCPVDAISVKTGVGCAAAGLLGGFDTTVAIFFIPIVFEQGLSISAGSTG